jgi:putative transposase
VLLFALRRAREKYAFRLYGLCVMSNHVHYLLEPDEPEDLPKIMHWLNWYTAMCFNRMLNRTGHFWEQRYHSTTFATTDTSRALNSLRYIHANPKAARISSGFAYRYSNYATYEKLTDDQLTEWHPAFLRLGQSLDECAARYRAFCRGHRIEAKPGGRRSFWARRWLPDVRATQAKSRSVPGQMGLWERC